MLHNGDRGMNPPEPLRAPTASSGNQILCRLGSNSDEAIIVDVVRRTVHFHRCHKPRKFLSLGASEDVECPLDDVEACYDFSSKSLKMSYRVLKIVTKTGSAEVPESASGYAELRDWIQANIIPNEGAHATENPGMGLLYVWAAIAGIICYVVTGVFARTPGPPAADGTVVISVVGYAVIGIVLAHFVVKLASRVLNVSLVPTLGLGLMGGLLGLAGFAFAVRFPPVFSGGPLYVFVLAGCTLGGAIGILQLHKQRSVRVSSARDRPGDLARNEQSSTPAPERRADDGDSNR